MPGEGGHANMSRKQPERGLIFSPMSKRARRKSGPAATARDDEGEREAKRLRRDLDELQSRTGAPSALLPDIHRLIGYQLPTGEMVRIIETTSNHFKLEKNPAFHIVLWSTLVDVEFRSPFSGEPYRIVRHFWRLLDLADPASMTDQEIARFWRAAYSRGHVAIRTLLLLVDQGRLIVSQDAAGIQQDLLPEARRGLLKQDDEDQVGHVDLSHTDLQDRYIRITPVVTIIPGDRIGIDMRETYLDRGPFSSVRFVLYLDNTPLPAQYALYRNNWLCIRDETRRRAAQGDVFQWTPAPYVLAGQSLRYFFCPELADITYAEMYPQEPTTGPDFVDITGKRLGPKQTQFGRLHWWLQSKSGGVGGLRVRCPQVACQTNVRVGFAGMMANRIDEEDKKRFLNGVATPNGRLHFVAASGRPVMAGRVYGDYTVESYRLGVYYGLFVDSVDFDALADWALVAAAEAERCVYTLIAAVPAVGTSVLPPNAENQRHTMGLHRLLKQQDPPAALDTVFEKITSIGWLELAVSENLEHFFGHFNRRLRPNLPNYLQRSARLLIKAMIAPELQLVHFSGPSTQ